MSLNFAIAGNSCSCFCMSRSSRKRLDSDEDIKVDSDENIKAAYAYNQSFNDMVVTKAIVTRDVMEASIRPTSHIGKAFENISIGMRDKLSKDKKEDSTREKAMKIAEDNVVKKSLLGSCMGSLKKKKKKDNYSKREDNRIDEIKPLPGSNYSRLDNRAFLYE